MQIEEDFDFQIYWEQQKTLGNRPGDFVVINGFAVSKQVARQIWTQAQIVKQNKTNRKNAKAK